MKFDIRKTSPNYINVVVKEGSTSIDLDWQSKDDAKGLLEDLDSACEDLRDFIGIEDPKEALVDALNEVLEAAEDWTRYVVEDTAPMNLRKYIQNELSEAALATLAAAGVQP